MVVRRPFAPKMVRAETPLETGLLTPLGAVGKERAVHIGLPGLGVISIKGEQAAELTIQTLLSCAADSSSGDLEIYLFDAIGVLDRAIEVDPVNEDLYRRAMAIEGRIGRSKAVVKRFNKLEAVLQDELDVDPDEETSALLRQIMREVEERKRSLAG
jgi:transcriptional activator